MEAKFNEKVHIMNHPLVAHKLTIMRDENTSVKDFRELVSEIGMLITYEATRDLPLTTKHIKTPICEMDAPTLAGKKFVVVPIEMVKRGCKHITLMVLVAAPEGIKAVQEKYPDVNIYAGALDDHLNEHGYIVPGLGDAGDRIFGTK